VSGGAAEPKKGAPAGPAEETLEAAAQSAAQMLRGCPAAAEEAEKAVGGGVAVLRALPAYAEAAATSLGGVWQELLRGAPGGSIAGNAAMPRTPPRGALSARGEAGGDRGVRRVVVAAAGAAGWEEACAAAAELRARLRLSLCDDADLTLAARVLAECGDFFARLRVLAAERQTTLAEAWEALLS